jgi:hypothetical protein
MEEMVQYLLLFFFLSASYLINKALSKLEVPVESRPVNLFHIFTLITARNVRNQIPFLRAPFFPNIKIDVCI